MECPIKTSRFISHSLSGRKLDPTSVLELHAARASEQLLCMASAAGYGDQQLVGIAGQIVICWRRLGVRRWQLDTFEHVVALFLITNPELESEEKDFGFMLMACSAALFCLDRAVVHARRGHIELAESWLDSAQELRFKRLAAPFSVQKSLARLGGEAKDMKEGHFEKRAAIRELWASGKYSSRDLCAEQESAALEMSFATARKALRGTPDPA